MNPGDRVRVDHPDGHEEGTLMPSTTADHLVVKLAGGYNVGVARADADVEVVERAAREVDATEAPEEGAATSVEFDDDLPTVTLVSTGGTIASTVDYRTGAVTARFDAEDVLRAVPELAGRANYRGRVVANILSENMKPAVWQTLAETVYEEVAGGADGIVVMHGTDTMAHSATAMSLMLDVPVPIVFTGSQRSADRPSSDNVMNAVCAVEAATADHAETLVCMHAGLSDDSCALHRGTRVRKNHTSRRDAFETVGARPLGSVNYETGAVTFRRDHTPRGDDDPAVHPALETDVALFKFAPGTGVEALNRLAGHAGVVIEGTGLGHVSTELIPRVEELVESGTVVAMTSQCLEGRVCDRVYDTGRDLLDAGVVEAGDTLPSAAYVKLMWVLANADDPRTAMQRDLANELQARSVPWT
jgi:glutamyl-tRNA(Gln) amidotransferase subunit D